MNMGVTDVVHNGLNARSDASSRVRRASATGTTPSVSDSPRSVVGDMLRSWRLSNRMSQSELARRVHVSRALINLLENGKRTPSRDVAERIVHLFHPIPAEARRFLEAAGFAPPPIQQHIPHLLLAIMADDPDNLIMNELAQVDLSAASTAWQQLVQALATLRIGDLALGRSALEQIVANHALSPITRLVATQKLVQVLRVARELDAANRLVTEAILSLDLQSVIGIAPHHGELLRALLTDEQGEVALRQNNFREAFLLFEKSRTDYIGLSSDATHDETDGPASKIGILGLAFSAHRLAHAQMFLERDIEAIEYCDEAEAYLAKLRGYPETSETNDVRRRLVELRAWAHARAQEYDEAMVLHRKSIEAATYAHDHIDEIVNWAYLGDDWWHKIEAAIEAAYVKMRRPNGLPVTLSSGQIWSYLVQQNGGEVDQWLKSAEYAYGTARTLQKQYMHAQSFGHILRGLASVMRLRQRYFEASAVLIQAEQHERAYKLGGRLPALFEVRADLYWDQNMPELALRWYQAALVAIKPLMTQWRERQHFESAVLSGHLSRIERKLRRLELTLAPTRTDREIPAKSLHRSTLSQSQEDARRDDSSRVKIASDMLAHGFRSMPRQTHDVLREIREAVVGTITRTGRVPITVSVNEVNAVWLQELADFESLPGVRILAQNNLSLSLSTHPPSALNNADAEPGTDQVSHQVVQLYQMRRDAFLDSVTSAQESAKPGSIVRDICYRGTIESRVDQENTYDRACEVMRLMNNYPAGYILVPLNHSMPFGFAVKGYRTLVEIPARFARKARIMPESADIVGSDEPVELYCYRFDDSMLADTLKTLFAMLFDLVDHSGSDETTLDWLHDLIDQAGSNIQTLGM